MQRIARTHEVWEYPCGETTKGGTRFNRRLDSLHCALKQF